MTIPQKIFKNNRNYIFVKQINRKLFLYKTEKNGFRECFSLYDLGLTPKRKNEYKLQPELFRFL